MKKIILTLTLVFTMIFTTSFCFADSTNSTNVTENAGNSSVITREKGPYWMYGGTRTYNQFFNSLTASAFEASFMAALGVPPSVIAGVLAKVMHGELNSVNVKVKATCTYRMYNENYYQHHHIYEIYKNGVYQDTEENYYYNTEPHRW